MIEQLLSQGKRVSISESEGLLKEVPREDNPGGKDFLGAHRR